MKLVVYFKNGGVIDYPFTFESDYAAQYMANRFKTYPDVADVKIRRI